MNNTFGTLFCVTTFGESHGAALGAVVDGMPAGIEIDPGFLQSEMDRRKPGQSAMTTARQEKDEIEILSGVFNGISTGTPIGLLLRNTDQHSSDYSGIAGVFRPGHADFTYQAKYGIRDYRGGGRSSGRETSARVAAGALAKLLLKKYAVTVRACAEQIGRIHCPVPTSGTGWENVEKSAVRCPDPEISAAMEQEVRSAAAKGDSVGGTVYGEICNVPAGLGEPVFDKFEALLAHGILSIGGIRGFEIGDGFACAERFGSENNDPISKKGFLSNHAGGILGGISNGDVITFRAAVKPTPSIALPQKTVSTSGSEEEIRITGRHDPCLVPRIVPVVEAMAAIVTADLILRERSSKI